MTSLDGVGSEPVRILYVNDDDAFSELVRAKLDRVDGAIECVSVADVDSAIETLSTVSIDCVVTAYALAGDTGIELAEAIRARNEEVPVVLFTGKDGPELTSEAVQAGLTDYIPIHTERDPFELLATRVRALVWTAREKRRADRADDRFRRTLERTTDGVYAVDSEWRVEYLNDRMAERVGRERDSIVGGNLWKEFPTLAGTELESKFRTAMATGEPASFELELGAPFDYWVELRVFADEDGLTVFSREITEAVTQKRELRRNETILRSVHDVVFVVDENLVIQFANPAAARVLGRSSASRLEGQRLKDLTGNRIHSEAAREFVDAVEDALEGISSDGGAAGLYDFDLQFDLETASGRRRFDVRLTPFEGSDRRQVLVVARDVTVQSEAQRQLERERDALRELETVMADSDLTTDERLAGLLRAGCATLGLDAGIVSNVVADDYEVVAAYAPNSDIEVGDQYDLESTYCEEVIASETVCSFANAVEGGKETHPVYTELGLESYIGVPLSVDGERYGTLNFSSPRPRQNPFGALEVTFVELLSELISTELLRDRNRQRLERSNKRLESLIQSAPLTIMEIDTDGTVLRWNRGAEEMFGWASEEVVGEFNPTVPEEKRAEFANHRRRALAGERIRGREIQRWTKDGTRLDVLLSTAPITNPDGEVTSVIALLDDITEQKRLENQLRALQRTAQQLNVASSAQEIGDIAVDAAADVLGLDCTRVWEYDEREDALVLRAETATAGESFGTSQRIPPGESLVWEAYEASDVRVRDSERVVDENGDGGLGDGDSDDGDTDDERVGVDSRRARARNELAVPLGTYGVISTSSPSVATFSETQVDLFRILGAGVEAALMRAGREAELRRQNERLDEFSSVVAHDLRNPLAVAKGFLELAGETGDEAHFRRVESAHDRIERLIADLLTLARGGATVEDGDHLELVPVAREAWGYVDTDAATLTVGDGLGTVYGDGGRLIQLFENLFRNAIEHGSNDVAITVGELDDGAGFYVEDDGAGIPPERREVVFDHGVTFSRGGTGFGLSIVADIAQAHGWAVSVTESSTGGARFEFESVA